MKHAFSMPTRKFPLSTAPALSAPLASTLATAAESDSQYRELVSLEMAIQGTVLESAVERGRLLAHDAEERFEAGLERVALGKRARVSWVEEGAGRCAVGRGAEPGAML